MEKTGIYIRVSTEDQAKDGFSIHAQREKLTKYAEANDWVVIDYYVDDGISGKNLVDRPEVSRMLEDIERKKINNVLIYKLDRLTRSTKDLIYLIELFEQNNCTFNSQTEKIDTSNAVGRMFVKIIGIFAEFERENLAERVSFGYEQKTREGNYTNTQGVYGYDYILGGNLIVNIEEAELVKKIFELYINGESYHKISKTFNMSNIATKRGGHWSANTIKSIINNPLYIGKVRYGVGKKNKIKSFEVVGKNIEPILSKEIWEEAHRIIKKRKNYNTRRYPSENSYFSHTIKCSKCGGNMSARQQIQHGKMYITYSCNAHSKGVCDATGFSHYKMEKSFVEYLETIKKLKPSKDIMKQEKQIDELENKKIKIESKLRKLESKKKNIRQKFIEDNLDEEEYQSLIFDIKCQLEIYKKEIKEILVPKKEINYSYSQIKDIVSNIKLNWCNLENQEKKSFLEKFINSIKVSIKNGKVIIDSVDFNKY